MRNEKQHIPVYNLERFKHVHRETTTSVFGYNNLDKSKYIPGFELYSSDGLISSVGPLKSDFYRLSFTLRGTLEMKIGLESYKHQPGTISLTSPNQLFAKDNISADAFGYYILFSSQFLNNLIPAIKMAEEFPFFDFYATPLFLLNEAERQNITGLIFNIDQELHHDHTGRVKAVEMYLYLILLEAKRSYERQELNTSADPNENAALLSNFRRLVSRHYVGKHKVSEYAELLRISANHLNRVVKTTTGKTASDTIREMLVLEAKSMLKYTTKSIGEISHSLDFSDPTTFNRFFRRSTGITPLEFRQKA